MTTTTEIATIENVAESFPILAGNAGIAINDILSDPAIAGSLEMHKLPKINVPGAGGTTFEFETADGTVETKVLEGIIIAAYPVRLFWEEEYGKGTATPPDCVSYDLKTGVGSPGGPCAECPMISSDNGNRPRCQEKRYIMLLLPDFVLPFNLVAPYKSVQEFESYSIKLLTKGRRTLNMTTKISLAKDKSQNGVDYAKLQFTPGTPISPEMVKMAEEYRAGLDNLFARRPEHISGFDEATTGGDEANPW